MENFKMMELQDVEKVEFDGWDNVEEIEEVEEQHIPMLFEKFLIAVNIVVFFIIAGINDFNFQALFIVLFMILVFGINCWIIKTFGQIFNE